MHFTAVSRLQPVQVHEVASRQTLLNALPRRGPPRAWSANLRSYRDRSVDLEQYDSSNPSFLRDLRVW